MVNSNEKQALNDDLLEQVSGGEIESKSCPYCGEPWTLHPTVDGWECYYCHKLLVDRNGSPSPVPSPTPSPEPVPVPAD